MLLGGKDEPGTQKARLLSIFGEWADSVTDLIRATPESDVLRRDIFDRPPILQWCKGRVALLGDSAHAMQPNLGQVLSAGAVHASTPPPFPQPRGRRHAVCQYGLPKHHGRKHLQIHTSSSSFYSMHPCRPAICTCDIMWQFDSPVDACRAGAWPSRMATSWHSLWTKP